MTLENGDHGALVQQILDTKKELEDGAKPKKGVEIEHESGMSDFNRQREREATLREIQKLKDSIQVILNCENPSSNLMLARVQVSLHGSRSGSKTIGD